MYGKEELAELSEVISEKSPFRYYGLGVPNKTDAFEKKVRAYFGTKFSLALSSGTGALFCAVAALGIGPGDEIILPTFGWFSDYYAITNMGAIPIFADIDESLSLDPVDFEEKITPATKAVIIIAFQGGSPNMDAIMEIANKYDIRVIEDISQGFGTEFNGKKLGTFGHVAIASFQFNKVLCCGEGGLLLTNSEKYFVRAVRYHDLGLIRPLFADQVEDKQLLNETESFAGNQYRMSELAGAVLLAQFDRLESMLDVCRAYHNQIRVFFSSNTNFSIRWNEGDIGVCIILLFQSQQEASCFEECLSAEGIPLGAKSACRNLMTQYPIKSNRLAHPMLPPFVQGSQFIDYENLNTHMKTDGILARLVTINIGPLFSDNDILDIIKSVKKVNDNLYP